MSGVYLYALLGAAPAADAGIGVCAEPLRLVPVDRLLAVVGDVREAPPPTPAALVAQDRVLRRLTASADAVLPVRFGTLLADDAALAEALGPRGLALERALERVAGCEQMTLRVWGEPSAPGAAAEPVSDGGPGTRYLAARRRARQVPEVAPLRRRLGDLVRAERVERHDRPPLLATVQHLVPRGQSARYLAAVEAAGAALRPWRVTVTGPWPPYAFGDAA